MIEKKVSILITCHTPRRLEEIFNEIFSSPLSSQLEIVYVDDAIDPYSWKLACQHLELHPSQMTVSRNRVPQGSMRNRVNLLRMATCKVYALTSEDSDLDINFILKEVFEYLELGYQKGFSALNLNTRLASLPVSHNLASLPVSHKNGHELPMLSRNPLVCVTVHNYNYGRFLRQCLDSLVNQTYQNVRIIFSDNASTDDSWEIANEFLERYPQKFSLTRNRFNMGSKINIQNCEFHIEGDYYIQLCSDDYLTPNCIEKCISIFQANPEAGMMIFHRNIVDANGYTSKEIPFFNSSFLAPAGSIADIYLMSSINPSISQIIYNIKVAAPKYDRTLIDRWFSNRFRDFCISIEYPVLYYKEPLMFHRLHGLNENNEAAKNLIEVIGPYVANLEFEITAHERNIHFHNKGKWIDKLSSLSLRYSYRAFLTGDTNQAKRYLHLSAAISPLSLNTNVFILLSKAIYGNQNEIASAIVELQGMEELLARTRSYDPPLDAQLL